MKPFKEIVEDATRAKDRFVQATSVLYDRMGAMNIRVISEQDLEDRDDVFHEAPTYSTTDKHGHYHIECTIVELRDGKFHAIERGEGDFDEWLEIETLTETEAFWLANYIRNADE